MRGIALWGVLPRKSAELTSKESLNRTTCPVHMYGHVVLVSVAVCSSGVVGGRPFMWKVPDAALCDEHSRETEHLGFVEESLGVQSSV